MNYDPQHPFNSGLLDEKELHEARTVFDGLCAELGIESHSARDMAAGLMITMFATGQRDMQHIRSAIQRFASELPSSTPTSATA
jgi:hypothetical protein